MVIKRVQAKVIVDRSDIEVEIENDHYQELLKSTSFNIQNNLNDLVKICYDYVTPTIVELANDYIDKGEKVFIVAKDNSHQSKIAELLSDKKIFLITKGKSINLPYGKKNNYDAVITTLRHAEGYDITAMGVIITSVYFSNQATREQLDHRIVRVTQLRKRVKIITVHAGILTNIFVKYEYARSISEAMKALADVGNK